MARAEGRITDSSFSLTGCEGFVFSVEVLRRDAYHIDDLLVGSWMFEAKPR